MLGRVAVVMSTVLPDAEVGLRREQHTHNGRHHDCCCRGNHSACSAVGLSCEHTNTDTQKIGSDHAHRQPMRRHFRHLLFMQRPLHG